MATFETAILVNSSVDRVWDVLADIGTISRWNPGVKSSHLTTEGKEGMGAGRRCNLGGKTYLDEEVVAWEPHKNLTMRITATNLPFRRADIRFNLKDTGEGTLVTVSPNYALKFGWFGSILDRFFVRRTYLKGMKQLLAGLKHYVEGELNIHTSSP